MWDLTTARRKHSLTGHARGVYSLTYNSEFHCLISGGFDHDALIFNPYYAQCIGRLKGHRDSLVRVQTVPGTPQIVTADVSGFVKIWDVRTFGCVQTLALEDERDSEARSAELTSFRVCPPHKRLALGGESRIVYFDAISEVVIDPELADQKPVTVCLYNTEQGTFLTAAGQTAKVWSGKTGALQAVYRNICDADITAMCFDESLKKFIVGDAEGNVKVLNFSNGSEMCHFQPPHDADVSAVYYMIGKASLLTASWDGSIREWDESGMVDIA
jgi:WD40 repeat protein